MDVLGVVDGVCHANLDRQAVSELRSGTVLSFLLECVRTVPPRRVDDQKDLVVRGDRVRDVPSSPDHGPPAPGWIVRYAWLRVLQAGEKRPISCSELHLGALMA
jgi:hypothetical protein